MPKRFGFPKAERLKSHKAIDDLFAAGGSVSVFPLRAVYKFSAAEKRGLQVGVSAPKRHFKKAVDRNRLKRLMREAYRLQKEELALKTTEAGLSGRIFFLYTDRTIADFETVKAAMRKCLQRLHKTITIENPQ